MKVETVERYGRVYVVKNGVESIEFVMPSFDGYMIFAPAPWAEFKTLNGAIEGIASLIMDKWYTVSEAALYLVELGKTAKPPVPQTMYRWLSSEGRFPGAIKIRGTGAMGRGGAWRIPETALREFKGGEKKCG